MLLKNVKVIRPKTTKIQKRNGIGYVYQVIGKSYKKDKKYTVENRKLIGKSEILNKILETNGCTISEDGTKLSSEDFTVLWYKDDKPVNESELAFIAPDDDTSYKIKVKYGVSRVGERRRDWEVLNGEEVTQTYNFK